MKLLISLLLLIPFSTSAQLIDELYNKIFHYRPFTSVSYSEVKKYKIKCIKYTSSQLQHTFKIDSLGNRIRDRKYITNYHYENFDSLGIMNSRSKEKSPKLKTGRYSKETIYLIQNLKEVLNKETSFTFHDSLTKCIIFYDKPSKTIILKNYSNWGGNVDYTEFLNEKFEFEYPKLDVKARTFFLNDKFELKKDSTFVEGTLGCERFYIVSNYKYNSKGQVIEKIVPGHFEEKRTYNSHGYLSEILVNGKLRAKYYYENDKLKKIVFASKTGINLIEIEY